MIENLPPAPVLLSDGTLSRPPGNAQTAMGQTLRRNPFYFADLIADWERQTGRDAEPPPAPSRPIEWGPIPDTTFADVPAAEWAALEEANRLREGLAVTAAGNNYWSAFLSEVQRLQM